MCDHCGCRDFAPVAELTAEHETILELAWEVAEQARAGHRPAAEAGPLLALLERHSAKEETGLYPELLGVGALEVDVIDRLEAEHRSLRSCLVGGTFDRRAFLALAAHIEEEELELFSAAMLWFDDDEWNAAGAAHRAVDDVAPRAVS